MRYIILPGHLLNFKDIKPFPTRILIPLFEFLSIAHPYLLADNRHYPFYLWRKVIKAHWSIKYLLVPFYVYSWLSICSRLGQYVCRFYLILSHPTSLRMIDWFILSSMRHCFMFFALAGKFMRRKIWVFGYFVATALVLIPAPLIEFRYYTIPFFFLVLHSHDDDLKSWLLMWSLYLALNVFTVIMFLYRPFHWDHEPGTQRFIW